MYVFSTSIDVPYHFLAKTADKSIKPNDNMADFHNIKRQNGSNFILQ